MSAQQASRRPADTPFKQQRLAAWQPILTPTWVIGTFLLIGLVFLPVGVVLKSQSDQVVEISKMYDGDDADASLNCKITEGNAATDCTVKFTITEDMPAPVYLYYELTNFYQNHRKYVKSMSFAQLRGEESTKSELDALCSPLTTVKVNEEEMLLSPCGLVANSLFSDVIKLDASSSTIAEGTITLDETGIAWESDLESKFSQPSGFKSEACSCASCAKCGEEGWCVGGTTLHTTNADLYTSEGAYITDAAADECQAYFYPDDATTHYLYESYPKIVPPTEGVKNEHFIVWMRTAGLPKFRKLYGSIDTDLKKGDVVSFTINNNFNVDSFQGSKALILSTVSWFGGKNPFLGQSYIVVGSVCIALSVIFGVKHMVSPRKLGDTKFLVWKEA